MTLGLTLYLLFLSFKILATLTCAVYCVRIAKLRLTQTFTWMLFAFAFMLWVIAQAQSLFFAQDILGIWKQFNIWIVVESQFIAATIIGCFLVGIFRTYYSMVRSPLTNPKIEIKSNETES